MVNKKVKEEFKPMREKDVIIVSLITFFVALIGMLILYSITHPQEIQQPDNCDHAENYDEHLLGLKITAESMDQIIFYETIKTEIRESCKG